LPSTATKGKAVLALWRHPEFKGAVLFDGLAQADRTYLTAFRKVISDLHTEGIGLELTTPIFHETHEDKTFTASATKAIGWLIDSTTPVSATWITAKTKPKRQSLTSEATMK